MVSIQQRKYGRNLERQVIFNMSAVIKINGNEVKEAFCIVDTLCNTIELNTVDGVPKKLDFNHIYAEVNIYGDEKALLSKF